MFLGRHTGIILLLRQISPKRIPDFFREVENGLIPPLTSDQKGICRKIDTFIVKPNQLGNTDPGTQKQGKDRCIADLGLGVITFRMRGKAISILGNIEKGTYLILFKTDDLFLMQLRSWDLCRVIDFDEPLVEKIFKKGTHGRKFSCLGTFVTGEPLGAKRVIGEVAQIDLDIRIRNALQIFKCDLKDLFSAKTLFDQEIKKDTKIITVIETCQHARAHLNPAQKVFTEHGQLLQKRINAVKIFQISFLIIILFHDTHIITQQREKVKEERGYFTQS